VNVVTEKISVAGNFRPNNEDAIACCESDEKGFFWMVIADGMGGHKAGEVASEMFVKWVKSQLQNIERENVSNWNDWLVNTVVSANLHIFNAAEEDPELNGMGTTGVILVCWQSQYYIAWVGDSRAYLLRDNQVQQVTQDHTAIQYLLDKGAISAREAKRSNTKHILARAIGIKPKVKVDVVSGSLVEGDVFLLSTDGVHDFLANKEIQAYLNQFIQGKSVTSELIDLALVNGSTDNLTFGAVKIDDLV